MFVRGGPSPVQTLASDLSRCPGCLGSCPVNGLSPGGALCQRRHLPLLSMAHSCPAHVSGFAATSHEAAEAPAETQASGVGDRQGLQERGGSASDPVGQLHECANALDVPCGATQGIGDTARWLAANVASLGRWGCQLSLADECLLSPIYTYTNIQFVFVLKAGIEGTHACGFVSCVERRRTAQNEFGKDRTITSNS